MTTKADTRLSDVRGMSALKARLLSALDADKLPPTCLFVGPQGRGKRTLALSLAAEILSGGAPPGREADAARRARDGRHPDLLVLAALVDERFLPIRRVRALLERCALTPSDGDRRVVVVPRLERVNEESGNALLKFFEEPPIGTVVLATAPDPTAVLETLRSRAAAFRVEPIPLEDVVAAAVAAGVPRETATILAPVSEGSPGGTARLARGDAETALFAPLRDLFDPRASAYRFAEAVSKQAKDEGPSWAEAEAALAPKAAAVAEAETRAAKEADGGAGGTSEAGRNWLRPLIVAVAFAARDALRGVHGVEPTAPEFLKRAGVPSPADSVAANALERTYAGALEALENLDRNLSFPLVLEVLARAAKTGQ